MKFCEVENKEKYFIQPFIKGNELIINISVSNNETLVVAQNERQKTIKLLKGIEKELISLYNASNYKGYEIVLKGYMTLTKRKKQLLLNDILLKTEYDLKIQSKRYNVRLQNLNIRFLKTKTKYIKASFSFKYSERNLDHIISQYIKTNLIDGLIFHKDVPYCYEDDEIIKENVCNELEGVIIDGIVGTTFEQKTNEETNEIKERNEVPCLHFLKCKIGEEDLQIPLDNFLENEKIKLYNDFHKIKNKKCIIKYYNILNKNGYFIVKIEE